MPFLSSLFNRRVATWQALLLASTPLVQGASYSLDTTYQGTSFLDGWTFFTDTDPTYGFVNYVSKSVALSKSYAVAGADQLYLGVDDTTVLSSNATGRNSVRIESTKSWTHGLFIADIAHMPGGICGTWPAYWMYGPDWPNNGEIDIIEGVNTQATDLMTIHVNSTVGDCTVAGSGELGTLQNSDCNYQANNYGSCGISGTDTTYGSDFNTLTGGVYAMDWTSAYVKIWFFARDSIPSDITAGSPDPSGWGTPQSNFAGSCEWDNYLRDNHLVINTDFCGTFGDAYWSSSGCQSANGGVTCEAYVAANPTAFTDAYWLFNSIKVYQSSNPIVSSSSVSSVVPASTLVGPGMGGSEVPSATTTPPAATSAASGSSGSSGSSSSGSSGSSSSGSGSSSSSSSVSSPPGWTYAGCYPASAVSNQHGTTNLTSNSPLACTAYCAINFGNETYAELSGTFCSCGSVVSTSALVDDASCNSPCPGDSSESCGGASQSTKVKRQAAVNYISVYERSGSSGFSAVSIKIAPTFSWVTTVVQTVYTDVCPTGFTEMTAAVTTTLSVVAANCGCVDTNTATIPMTTSVVSCSACGAENGVVTVTVPVSGAASPVSTKVVVVTPATTSPSVVLTSVVYVTPVPAASSAGYVNTTSSSTPAETTVPYMNAAGQTSLATWSLSLGLIAAVIMAL